MKPLIKNFVFILIIFLVVSSLFALFSQPLEKEKEISLTKLVEDINNGEIKEILVSGNNITITYQNDSKAKSKKEIESALSESLLNYGVNQEMLKKVDIRAEESGGVMSWLGPASLFLFPLLIIGVFFWMIFRQAKLGATQTFNFSKARARLFGAEGQPKEKITFKDVAGSLEAKEELKEIVDFLKTPKKFLNMGARIPRGVLLMGPPGTGKTLLARAVAGEAHVPFFHISGSEFVEMFVGIGAARTRDLFATAKKAAPSIIFIDELDAVGRHRGTGLGGGHDEREQTLNQILTEMDGFERDTNVIVMAATNRPDVLDSALLRPGRFDRRVVLDLPDINDREEILKIHAKGKPLAINVNLREIAERTPGFSGADLANLVNESALFAARRNKLQVFQEELLESIDKVLLGPERKSHILSEKEKNVAAFHEAGHALVSSSLPQAEPVRKISIIARGRAAGYTLKLPTMERHLKTKSEFLADLATFLGGYCAENLVFGEITTGASNDLEMASELARKLVKEYGMSEKLGPISFGEKEELIFLGKELGEQRNYSEKVAAEIDNEVSNLMKHAQQTAKTILKKRRALLNKIAHTLAEKETIEREEFEKLVKPVKKEKAKTIRIKKFRVKEI
ncbi:MAG: ATP-dependent zinc metalloprotease FtsH [Candidatus Nealsonbacteria bacterium]|nr:ATP-dependent zinc metalloprotease FtsH [Candidatus Nealsonbacteria bacterium]